PGRASGCTLCRGRAWTAAGVARPADNAASGPPRANETRSCGQSPASGRWPISKGLWRTTLEPATHPHLCTSRLLLLAEFGDGVLQRWGFFIPAILRNMLPAILSILLPAMTKDAERRQRQQRRQALYDEIHDLYAKTKSIRAVADRLGIDRRTVRKYLNAPE